MLTHLMSHFRPIIYLSDVVHILIDYLCAVVFKPAAYDDWYSAGSKNRRSTVKLITFSNEVGYRQTLY